MKIYFSFIVILWTTFIACAEEDYFLDLSRSRTGGSLIVNGFEFANTDDSSLNISALLTTYLKNGSNDIILNYRPKETSDELSDFTVTIAAHPRGISRLETEPSILYHKEIKSKSWWLSSLPAEQILMKKGKEHKNEMWAKQTFGLSKKSGKKRELSVALKGSKFERMPSRIEINRLHEDLKNTYITLSSSNNVDQKIQFGPYTFTKKAEAIDLREDKIIEGKQWYGKSGFDSVYIEGDSDREDDEYISLKLYEIMGDIQEQQKITCTGLPKWAWQKGKNIEKLTKMETKYLYRRIQSIRNSLDSGDVEAWLSIFAMKYEDLAKAGLNTPEGIKAKQRKFVTELSSLSGWGMEPISEKDIKIIHVNKTVIKLERTSGENLLNSNFLTVKGRKNRFKIPLYMSLIDGVWQVVK